MLELVYVMLVVVVVVVLPANTSAQDAFVSPIDHGLWTDRGGLDVSGDIAVCLPVLSLSLSDVWMGRLHCVCLPFFFPRLSSSASLHPRSRLIYTDRIKRQSTGSRTD